MNAQGADTFRYTASEPNLMQVTKPFGEINFRHLFYAGKGRKIVGADYSQMELRNIAEVTDDPLLLNAFNTGADMHVLMAEKVLGRELKKGERNLGKAVNFGVRSYGGSKNALIRSALMYGILLTEEEANKYVQEIRKASQEIQNWGIRITKQAERDGYLQTPIGHRRYFEEVRETQTRNTVIQTFSAGIMKQALVEIYRILKQDFTDAWIVLQVYDEVVIDCKEEDAEAIKEIIEREMVSAATSWMHKVPVVAEGYISNSWEK
jgi:DNA polymerase-1